MGNTAVMMVVTKAELAQSYMAQARSSGRCRPSFHRKPRLPAAAFSRTVAETGWAPAPADGFESGFIGAESYRPPAAEGRARRRRRFVENPPCDPASRAFIDGRAFMAVVPVAA
ncbi:MAG: hypothetical protein AMXMBFR83_23170 [Phycisphaerae bacterium]